MMTAFNSFKETHLDIMLIKRDQAFRYANTLNYHREASTASSGREPLSPQKLVPAKPAGRMGTNSGRLRRWLRAGWAPGRSLSPPPEPKVPTRTTPVLWAPRASAYGLTCLVHRQGRSPRTVGGACWQGKAPWAGCHPVSPRGEGVLTEPGESRPADDTQNTLHDSGPRGSHGPVGCSEEPVPESSEAKQEPQIPVSGRQPDRILRPADLGFVLQAVSEEHIKIHIQQNRCSTGASDQWGKCWPSLRLRSQRKATFNKKNFRTAL